MTAPKQNSPSFVSITSIISILFHCAGFLRIELELTEQQKRISVLETIAETKASSDDPDINGIENTQGEMVAVFPWEKKNTKDAGIVTSCLFPLQTKTSVHFNEKA